VVQWASRLGATVLATVSTDEKAAVAAAAGAHHVIRYDEVDFVDEVRRITDGRGVDYIVDGVGAGTFAGGLRALADRGRICVFGRAGGLPESFSPLELTTRSLTVSGGYMTNFLRTREEVLRKAGDLWSAVREGWLTPLIHSVRPLSEAAAAHTALESRATAGKSVLQVSGGD
jgi:NADPH2:quinone reductase